MKLLVQRVSKASVVVEDSTIGAIQQGLCVFVCMANGDTMADIQKMAAKLVNLRIFEDENHKMNLSVQQVGGGILLVPQFTLMADCMTGNRPSFAKGATGDKARTAFEMFVQAVQKTGVLTQTGRFQADMHVSLINEGPATFILEHKPEPAADDRLEQIVRENRTDLTPAQQQVFVKQARALRSNLELRRQQQKGKKDAGI